MTASLQLQVAVVAVLGGLVVAALDTQGRRSPRSARWAGVVRHSCGAAALVGAVVGGWANPRSLLWIAAAAGAACWQDRPDRSHPLGPATVLLCVASLAGVWSAVPDTEPPVGAAAALLPLAVLWALRRRAPGPAATAALVVAVLGSVWVGSAGWGAALTVGCVVGMLAVAPLVLGLGVDLGRRHLAFLSLSHLAVALWVPRVLMSRSVGVAVVLALSALAALTLVALGVRRQLSPARPAGSAPPR